jgi:integrase
MSRRRASNRRTGWAWSCVWPGMRVGGRAGERLLARLSMAISPLRESKLLTKVLQPAAEAAGPGRVTWHQFRHIHSSLLNDLRVPVKIAQEQLGHASISTTLNIYRHVVDASHRKSDRGGRTGIVCRCGPKWTEIDGWAGSSAGRK